VDRAPDHRRANPEHPAGRAPSRAAADRTPRWATTRKFRRFLLDSFGLDDTRVGPSGLLRVRRGGTTRLVWLGPLGAAVPVWGRDPRLGARPGTARRASRPTATSGRSWNGWSAGSVGDWTADALTTTRTHLPRAGGLAAARRRPPPRSRARHRERRLVFDLYGTLVDPLRDRDRPRAPDAGGPRRGLVGDEPGGAPSSSTSFRLTAMNRYEDFRPAHRARPSSSPCSSTTRPWAPRRHRPHCWPRYDSLEPFPPTPCRPLQALRDGGALRLALAVERQPGHARGLSDQQAGWRPC